MQSDPASKAGKLKWLFLPALKQIKSDAALKYCLRTGE